jgi:hypothetical protein
MSEKIGRFEDLIAWQKARALTAMVYMFKVLIASADEVGRIIGGLRTSAKRRREA